MYGIWLILVLAATGGAIAFIGDRLGSKIGKKKISVFNMRPRDTATFITIITGLLITLTTLGVSAAVSSDVRTALFGMEKLNQNLSETKEKLAAATAELDAAQTGAKKVQEDLKKSQDELSTSQANLAKSAAELETSRLDLQKLDKSQKELLALNDNLKTEREKLLGDNAAIAQDNKRLTGERDGLIKETDDLKRGLISMREGDIVFRAGEVLAAGKIDEALSEDDVRLQLGGIIARADNESAARLGTRPGENAGRIWLSGRDYDEAVNRLANSKTPYAVRIAAFANLVRGEPVRCALELFPNLLVYKADEFIVGKRYDLNDSEKWTREDTERIIGDFLHEVNVAAKERGIVPDPLRGSVGVIEGNQIYELEAAIMKTKGGVIIVAHAAEDTYTLGPLHLRVGLGEVSKNLWLNN